MGSAATEKCFKEKLIRSVKKERLSQVKQIMEEAVTKKFVHEDSASVTSLCAAVETCVSHGLKRRALGLFKSSSTTALLHKVAKSFQPAARIVQLVAEVENCDPNKRSSSGSESTSKIGISVKPPLQKRNSVAATKYLWIRLALVEKQLAKIIDYIVQNNNKYYEKDALVADPDYGSILSSLLVGPCALDYSKLRTGEHLWTDPPADELVQRHRISSGHFPPPASPPTHKRPALHYKGSSTFSNSDDNQRSKDYVESLHQNNKSTLLYGKNNVLVYLKDVNEPLAGYLSLHQCGELLNLKWTPNQLMNGCNESTAYDKSLYWQYALNVVVHEIVYVHCHQGPESDWIVLVGQDGVQRPPIHFPRGGHLLAFLSCLENGLLPHGMLDPPLWSQRGKGKVFPKLKRKGSRFYSASSTNKEESVSEEILNEQNASDFVFRIVYPNFSRTFPQIEEMFEDPVWKLPSTPKSAVPPVTPRSTPLHSVSTTSSTSSSKSLDQQPSVQEPGEPIQVVCQTMKKQIISRAFYGWLAHCRHLRTVRTHLVGLVRQQIVKPDEPEDASLGLTEAKWNEMQAKGDVDMNELYRLVYFGGMASSLRRKLWPIMLAGNVNGDDPEKLRREYEDRMSEWLAVEAIVRQKDRETMAANLAKLSSEGTLSGEQPQPSHAVLQTHGSNEVFEDNVSIDSTSSSHETSTKPSAEDAQEDPGEQKDDDKDEKEQRAECKETDETASPSPTIVSASASPAKSSRSSGGGGGNCRSKKVSFSSEGDDNKSGQRIEGLENGTQEKEKNADERKGSSEEKRDKKKVCEDAPSHQEGDNGGKDKEEEGGDDSSLSSDDSPDSSRGGIYTNELLEAFGLNIHRIDKDVKRCDRNYWYFTESNLDKLRNVMCTYVWEHMDIGYVQGMCDLAAPLLVILDDEAEAYGCFRRLMERMSANFPTGGGAMDAHFANMRSLLQVLDHDLFALIRQNGDYTHFYFCYRWFLLDFKREFCYEDVFLVWETIWAARQVASSDYVLFLALALLNYYRDIILANSMDFTDIIKFFNEMAERHDAKVILQIARSLVLQLQTLIENK